MKKALHPCSTVSFQVRFYSLKETVPGSTIVYGGKQETVILSNIPKDRQYLVVWIRIRREMPRDDIIQVLDMPFPDLGKPIGVGPWCGCNATIDKVCAYSQVSSVGNKTFAVIHNHVQNGCIISTRVDSCFNSELRKEAPFRKGPE
jgi:hypothetical protein